MADTAAALVIQLTAETRDFQKEMRKATGVFDAEGRKIERRQAQLRKNMENNFAGFGRNIGVALSAAAVIGFSRSILNTADALSDASQQLGVTVQQLQGLDYAARTSGASSEKLSQALSFLADGLGEAEKGEGNIAKAMRASGIQMGSTIQVLYDVAERVKRARTETEKMNIATTYLGARAGKTMVSFLNQGADGLRRLQEEAAKKGQIWDPETLGKLDAAKDSFITLEKAMIKMAALPASAFITDLSRVLDQIAEGKWKEFFNTPGVAIPTAIGAAGGFALGGPLGAAAAGSAAYYLAKGKIIRPNKSSPNAAANGPPAEGRHGVPLSPEQIAASLRQAEQVQQMILQAGEDAQREMDTAASNAVRAQQILAGSSEDVRRSTDDVTESMRDVVREQDQGLLARAQDWSNFAEIQKEVIEDLSKLEIQSVEARRDADLRALELRRQSDQDHLNDLKATEDQKLRLDEDYATQRVSIEQDASNKVKVIRQKETDDIAVIQTKGIQVADRIRRGLLDIGIAALHGFGSMKDAAANALEQIAEFILELYVLKPLIEAIMGPSGTSGGGLIGALLSSIPGFASGTNSAPGGLALVGERGPELVNLPKGSQVIPNIPSMSRGGNGPVIVQNFDLSGAVITDQLFASIKRTANAEAQSVVAQYDRSVIPSRVRTLTGDPRRNY